MASIMTNASALTALQSLNATNKNLETTQSRISTGYRVAEASDNAAYWSIATTMRSDNKALSTVQDALGLGASKIDTAYTGMNKAIETVNDIKTKLVAANGASACRQGQVRHRNQGAAGPAEELRRRRHLLRRQLAVDRHDDGPYGCRHVRRRQDRRRPSTATRPARSRSARSTSRSQDIKLYDAGKHRRDGCRHPRRHPRQHRRPRGSPGRHARRRRGRRRHLHRVDLALTDGTLLRATRQITDMIGVVEGALKDMTTAATNLGAAKTRVDGQKTFTTSLMDSIDRGVGQLVDADMNKESTRLQALQVQQQLGIQALSIANGNSQSILSLFRG